MLQPGFFDQPPGETVDAERIVLDAFGDFQARGKLLAERELPLDRLRGALRRAAEKHGVAELSDEQATAAMTALGARVRRVPAFFAKHPFRVTVPDELAAHARDLFAAADARQ